MVLRAAGHFGLRRVPTLSGTLGRHRERFGRWCAAIAENRRRSAIPGLAGWLGACDDSLAINRGADHAPNARWKGTLTFHG